MTKYKSQLAITDAINPFNNLILCNPVYALLLPTPFFAEDTPVEVLLVWVIMTRHVLAAADTYS